MSNLDVNAAAKLARERLDQIAESIGDQLEFLMDQTKEINQGWVFFYNTRDFVHSRNPMDSLAGNGPLLVTFQGSVHELPSAIPWEEAVKQI